MALDLFKLMGTVSVETNSAERELHAIDGAAKETKKGLDDAGDAAEKAGAKINKSGGQARDAAGRFVAGGRQAEESAKRQTSALSRLSSQLDDMAGRITRVGVGLTASITLPLAGATAAIIATGSQTETALNRLQGTSGATTDQMERVRATARELGKDLTLPNTSAKDAALAMLELNKGGLSVEQSMDAARGTIQLAKAALIGEAQAATITADALNTFNLGGDQAVRVADLLAGSASASSGEVTDMASALAQAGAVARGANVSIEDTVTAISLLAKNGIKGSDAGTSLKTFLLALQTPVSDGAAKALKLMNLNAYDAQKRLKPLPQLLGEFRAKLDTLNDPSKAAFLKEVFGADAVRAARILFGEGTAGFEKMRAAVTRSGQAEEQAAAATKGLAGAWGGLVSVAETIGNDIYDDFKEPLTNLILLVTNVVSTTGDAWNSLSPATKTVIAGLLAIAAVAGPVLVAVGAIAGALAGLGVAGAVAIGSVIAWGAPLVAVFAAAGAAAYAFYLAFQSNLGGVRDLSLRVWEAVKAHTLGVISVLSAAWARFYPTLSSLAQKSLALVVSLWESTGKRIAEIALVAFNAVAPIMRRILAQVLDVVDFVLKVIDGDWQGAWKAFVRFVETGVQTFTDVLSRMPEAAARVIGLTVKALLDAAAKLHDAGLALGRAFIAGFILAVTTATATISNAIADALILAAAGVSAESIGASLWERFKAGMAGAASSGGIDGNNRPNWGAADGPWGEHPADNSSGLRNLDLGGKRGGGGGGRGKKDLASLYEQLGDAESARKLAAAGLLSSQLKAGLDAELSVLDAGLRAQMTSVQDYWTRRSEITLAGIDSEIGQLRYEQKLLGETYKEKFEAIGKDKDASPAERVLKQQIESARWAEKNYQLEGQLAEATSKRAAAMQTIPLEAAAAARELEKTVNGLRADFLDSKFDPVEATKLRVNDKYAELERLAAANAKLYPEAAKWVEALKRAEISASNLARVLESVDLSKGYLSLETAKIQDRITDKVIGEREGRREIYELELKYQQALRGTLKEALAIAEQRGDKKAALQIQQQIRETERLGHVIDTTRAKARGIFEGAFSHGLAELNKGLGHAAATFAVDLIDGIKREADARLTNVLSEALFGKTDEFGSDGGLLGKLLGHIGLGGIFSGKEKGKDDPAAAVTTTIERTSKETQARLDVTGQDITLDADYNTDRILAALHELDQTMESMRPAQPGFFKGLAGAALGGFVSGLGGAVAGKIFGGGGGGATRPRTVGGRNDEGLITPPVTVRPVLQPQTKTYGHALGGLINGPGTSTSDSIAAFLSNGEFVMSAAAVRRIGVSALQYMNAAGRMPQRFASGGSVGSVPVAAPARSYARDSARPGSGGNGGERFDVRVSVHPNRDGRVRSASQVDVEITRRADNARRDM